MQQDFIMPVNIGTVLNTMRKTLILLAGDPSGGDHDLITSVYKRAMEKLTPILEANNLHFRPEYEKHGSTFYSDIQMDDGTSLKDAAMKAMRRGIIDGDWGDFARLDFFVSKDVLSEEDAKARAEEEEKRFQATVKSWTAPFQGQVADKLWEHINFFFHHPQGTMRYANVCAIVQSSGMGKSRAVDQLGKKCFMIPICLREGVKGYPPADEGIRDHLIQPIKSEVDFRDRCGKFFTSLFKTTLFELQKETSKNSYESRESLALWFHTQMSPKIDARGNCAISDFRERFSTDVIKNTKTSPTSNEEVVAAANELIKFINDMFGTLNGKVQVLVAIDEAHVLNRVTRLTNNGKQGKVLSWLKVFRRIFQAARPVPVWGLFLSTTGKLSQLNPTSSSDPSNRVQNQTLFTVPPFTDLKFDIFAPLVQMNNSDELIPANKKWKDWCAKISKMDGFEGPLQLRHVTHVRWMASYGRPLFALQYDYGDKDSRAFTVGFAMQKLLCLDDVNVRFFDKEKVLACLSQRLCLEFNSTSYNADEETQIESHMRVCIKIAKDNQYIDSISGAEPILGEAAALLMMSSTFKPAKALKQVLTGFAISKGDRGELVAMLAATVARDMVVLSNIEELPVSDCCLLTTGELSEENEDSHSDFRAVRVSKFMESLFRLQNEDVTSLELDFPKSYLHFNHFIKAFEHRVFNTENLLLLLTRGAALLCANCMPGIDFVLPILMGHSLSKVATSAILVQVKNVMNMTEAEAQDIFEGMNRSVHQLQSAHPVIRIVFSFGSQKEIHYYGRRTIKYSQKKYTVHDFWCGGVGSHLLPLKKDTNDDWEALARTSTRWLKLFRNDYSRKESTDRRTLWPCGGGHRAHWSWYLPKGASSEEDVVDEEEDEEMGEAAAAEVDQTERTQENNFYVDEEYVTGNDVIMVDALTD